jgi:hypothetical protein
MSDVLTPRLAISYLAELQPSLRAAAIYDSGGRMLAGEPPRDGGEVFRAKSDSYAISALVEGGLPALVRLDLDSVLAELERDSP